MAIKQSPGLWWTRLHFLLRFLGLTGALVAVIGLVLIEPRTWLDVQDAILEESATSQVALGGWLLAAGAVAALLTLAVEVIGVLRVAAGRRSLVGFNAVVQVVLGAVLLIGLNVWSFQNGKQIDWTRDKLFTLPDDDRAMLAKLDQKQGETKVIVFLRNLGLSERPEKTENLDFDAKLALLRQTTYRGAAQRQVVEKVKNLVDLLRQVGPQLSVDVLDENDEAYADKARALTKDSPELLQAIASAPESRLFIQGNGKLQQLGFDEFYQLDLPASQKAGDGRGNLVLLGQGKDGRGVGPFVKRLLNLEQRKPRVGILAIHPSLTTEGSDPMLSLAGLRKSLTLHGFDVKDVILKKWGVGPEPLPAADTFAESKLENLEGQLADLDDDLKSLEAEVKVLASVVEDLTPKPGENTAKRLAELSEKYRKQIGNRTITEEERALNLTFRKALLRQVSDALATTKKERERVRAERDKLDVDRLSEARRLTDVKAKLAYALADCDLLIIPRLTRPASDDFFISPRFYRLSEPQVSALRDYLKSGKPILACFGPMNPNPRDRAPPGPPMDSDGLDQLLADLGIRLGKQTILTAADAKAFSERRQSGLIGAGSFDVLPLDFDSSTEAAGLSWQKKSTAPPNELRRGLQVTAHSIGQAFDIRLRFPRPIYYEAPGGKKPNHDPVFLLSPAGWNEDQPFPTRERRPRFTPPAPDDPNAGTVDAKRRGQFPVGVAVESSIPASWDKGAKDKKVRVAAVGHAEVFVGADLSPPREKLLLQTANWLLGRSDYLPNADHPWSYPRLALTPEDPEHKLWLWGTEVGLPVLFAYLGVVVLLFRRLR
jgi:hypothetical protein